MSAEQTAASPAATTAQSPPSAPSPSAASKRRRTAAAGIECCRTCRLRKVKCSGNPGNASCSNCARLELVCSFNTMDKSNDYSDKVLRTTPSASHTEAGTLRKRAQRACSQCHAHKTKCSGDLPRCKRCETADLPCEYTATKRKFTNVRFQNAAPSDDSTSPNATAVPRQEKSQSPIQQPRTAYDALLVDPATLSEDEHIARRDFLLRHMDIFMEFFYYVPCLGFLNPDEWYQDINDMTISGPRAAALASITCFFYHPGEEGRNFGLKCAGIVDLRILETLNKFSEEGFMLLALNSLFYLLHGSFAKVWNCFGMLSRLMIGMQVNWEANATGNETFRDRERINRIAWQVFSMDRLLAGGYDEYITCRADLMTIRLPCLEDAFRENRSVLTPRLSEMSLDQSSLGLHGWQMRTVDLRHRIQVSIKRLAHPEGSVFEPSKVMKEIHQLQKELSRLHLGFPITLQLNDASMDHYMSSPDRLGYVWLHNHVGVSHIDLYRFALPGIEDFSPEYLAKLPAEFVAMSRKQAVAHGLSVARFIRGVYEASKREPSTISVKLIGDYSICHMSTQALRVILIALQYDLYINIQDCTTAPPWSNAIATAEEIHELIYAILAATESWSKIFRVTKQAYDLNKSMVEEFFKTNKFVELPVKSERENGNQDLGLGNIIESIRRSLNEEASKFKHERSPSERLSGPPRSSSSSDRHSPVGGGMDAVYGPPGIPTFLQNAHDPNSIQPWPNSPNGGGSYHHTASSSGGDTPMTDTFSTHQMPQTHRMDYTMH